MDSVDWREIKMRAENKRRTNADQPLTSTQQRRFYIDLGKSKLKPEGQ
jgi:hypothetical protein